MAVQYYLMNKDVIVAEVEMTESYGEERFVLNKQTDDYLPYGFRDMNHWLEGRQAAKHRRHLAELMKTCECYKKSGFISMTRCASLTDSFWVKRADDTLNWADVNLYENKFDDVVARIAFDGTGLYGQKFSPTTPELSTSGSFEKCWVRDNGGIALVKRGTEGACNSGMEPYSEALCSQLGDALGYRHVPYKVMRYHDKLASKCPVFTDADRGFVNMAAYTEKEAFVETMLELCSSLGCEDDFRRMLIFDAVTVNVDRHSGNYGFVVDNATGEVQGLAPLFDHNLALFPYLMEQDDVEEYYRGQGPKLGGDFIETARAVLTPELRADLVNLKSFEYEDPGEGFPAWKLRLCNELKDRQIKAILA